ncbi:OmpA family protein, partial [Francisella tularensis subsp. holarctica]|nr:OmpA family protein [Francisella tularensis subsp. holarctica]
MAAGSDNIDTSENTNSATTQSRGVAGNNFIAPFANTSSAVTHTDNTWGRQDR